MYQAPSGRHHDTMPLLTELADLLAGTCYNDVAPTALESGAAAHAVQNLAENATWASIIV